MPDEMEEWEKFASKNILYWKKFVNKWVIYNSNPNRCIVEYGELVNNTYNEVEKVLKFINPKGKIDNSFLHSCIEKENKHVVRKAETFRFFRKKFIESLENQVADEMKKLNLKTVLKMR
jgi:hypothetical protein